MKLQQAKKGIADIIIILERKLPGIQISTTRIMIVLNNRKTRMNKIKKKIRAIKKYMKATKLMKLIIMTLRPKIEPQSREKIIKRTLRRMR